MKLSGAGLYLLIGFLPRRALGIIRISLKQSQRILTFSAKQTVG